MSVKSNKSKKKGKSNNSNTNEPLSVDLSNVKSKNESFNTMKQDEQNYDGGESILKSILGTDQNDHHSKPQSQTSSMVKNQQNSSKAHSNKSQNQSNRGQQVDEHDDGEVEEEKEEQKYDNNNSHNNKQNNNKYNDDDDYGNVSFASNARKPQISTKQQLINQVSQNQLMLDEYYYTNKVLPSEDISQTITSLQNEGTNVRDDDDDNYQGRQGSAKNNNNNVNETSNGDSDDENYNKDNIVGKTDINHSMDAGKINLEALESIWSDDDNYGDSNEQFFNNMKNKQQIFFSEDLNFDLGDTQNNYNSSSNNGNNKGSINGNSNNNNNNINSRNAFTNGNTNNNTTTNNNNNNKNNMSSSSSNSSKNAVNNKRVKDYIDNFAQHQKTLISENVFEEDQENVTRDLNDTIKKVHTHVEQLANEKVEVLKAFEKKLKKFIFDYRYDQYHEPRKYQSKNASHEKMKIKFRDARFDERKISYKIAGLTANPFCFYANEIDLYVFMETNEHCLKRAYYDELEQYLRAVTYGECEVESNHVIEQRVFLQCITVRFIEKRRLVITIRIHQRQSNIYSSRDLILNQFFLKNPIELSTFSSFVLYWAQKRQVLSLNCVDKTSMVILIMNFFQLSGRLHPSVNYDILKIKAKNIENLCRTRPLEQKLEKQNPNQKQSSTPTPTPALTSTPGGQTIINNHQMVNDDNSQSSMHGYFDFDKFQQLQSANTADRFIITYKQSRESTITGEPNNKKRDRDSKLQFNVIPLIRPEETELYQNIGNEEEEMNYGVFFYRFMHYLKQMILTSRIAVSLAGDIIQKPFIDDKIPVDPIIVNDPVFPDCNLLSHLSHSLDAFNHLMDQINLVLDTLQEKSNPKKFLTEIEKPNFRRTYASKKDTLNQ